MKVAIWEHRAVHGNTGEDMETQVRTDEDMETQVRTGEGMVTNGKTGEDSGGQDSTREHGGGQHVNFQKETSSERALFAVCVRPVDPVSREDERHNITLLPAHHYQTEMIY